MTNADFIKRFFAGDYQNHSYGNLLTRAGVLDS